MALAVLIFSDGFVGQEKCLSNAMNIPNVPVLSREHLVSIPAPAAGALNAARYVLAYNFAFICNFYHKLDIIADRLAFQMLPYFCK